MKRFLVMAAIAGLVSGCAPKIVDLQTRFDAGAATYIFMQGNNTISGQGFLRQQGGTVVTCASYEIGLVPATPYASERMQALYGSTEHGYTNKYIAPQVEKNADYARHRRVTRCDAQGNFKFEKVADGDYYLTGGIIWYAGYVEQGGSLMQRVSVKGGETKTVLLTY